MSSIPHVCKDKITAVIRDLYIVPSEREDYSASLLATFDKKIGSEIASVTIVLSSTDDWWFTEKGKGSTAYELVELMGNQAALLPDHVFTDAKSVDDYGNVLTRIVADASKEGSDPLAIRHRLEELRAMRSKVLPRNKVQVLQLIRFHRTFNKLLSVIQFTCDVAALKAAVGTEVGFESAHFYLSKKREFERLRELYRDLNDDRIPPFLKAAADFEKLNEEYEAHRKTARAPVVVPAAEPVKKKKNFCGHICVPLAATAALVIGCAALYRRIYP